MKFEVFEAKTLEDAKQAALDALNVTEEEIISTHEEKKGKLFKASTVLFKAIKITCNKIINKIEFPKIFSSKNTILQ